MQVSDNKDKQIAWEKQEAKKESDYAAVKNL